MTISKSVGNLHFSISFPPQKNSFKCVTPFPHEVFPKIVFPGRFNQTPSGSGQQVAIKDQELDCQGAQQKAGCGSFGPRLRAARSSSGVTWGHMGPPYKYGRKFIRGNWGLLIEFINPFITGTVGAHLADGLIFCFALQ